MIINYVYQRFPFQGPPKLTPIGIFDSKINHLATLLYGIAPFKKGLCLQILFGWVGSFDF
jgi:hypothetical protein